MDRIAELRAAGLTTTMVVGDSLRHRLAPLQHCSSLVWLYTENCNATRTHVGEEHNLKLEEMAAMLSPKRQGLHRAQGPQAPPGQEKQRGLRRHTSRPISQNTWRRPLSMKKGHPSLTMVCPTMGRQSPIIPHYKGKE
ncbi:hypothetical protein E2562_011400 [Oryza meyeriana var. granulata]|uniref:Uncharacterized protein n=1 Tax=Oryza meyeriana var. granulata TaxID=110450 RepID=A0A6G1ECJ5_9ORYZ|nr:hypothetical protein E2562_011400 [Oryza meyeriana var. granulata]